MFQNKTEISYQQETDELITMKKQKQKQTYILVL